MIPLTTVNLLPMKLRPPMLRANCMQIGKVMSGTGGDMPAPRALIPRDPKCVEVSSSTSVSGRGQKGTGSTPVSKNTLSQLTHTIDLCKYDQLAPNKTFSVILLNLSLGRGLI